MSDLLKEISQAASGMACAVSKRADTKKMSDANGGVDLSLLESSPVSEKNHSDSLIGNPMFPQPRR